MRVLLSIRVREKYLGKCDLLLKSFTSDERQGGDMRLRSISVTTLAILGLLIHPTSAGANDLNEFGLNAQGEKTKVVKLLADHPGAATALTAKQKSEIRKVLARGNQNLRCTGLTLAGQRESMYRVVRLRAQLVCEYAKSIDPSITTTVKEKIVKKRNLNGRVRVVSN
jgi:hypothetical protein